MERTPAQFAKKLAELPGAVKGQQHRAIEARALVQKRFLVAAALRRTRKARPSWVQYRIVDDVAALRLRGGMAHLTEKGSYKKPEGWPETPRTVSARGKAKGKSQAGALRTPEGPRASVMHPALRARHFWEEGLDAGRVPGHRAYQESVDMTIVSVFRT